ncbi:MAG: hypothetical protein PVI88_03320 [Nitrosopumilaceae archaeon]|jgi:hypothetical protein
MYWTKLGCTLASGILLFSGMSVSSFGEGVIDIFSLNTEITSTESVLVTGFVSSESFFKPVKLEVYDPNGDLIYSPTINFDEDGHFSWLFHPPLGKYSTTGTYEIIASHEEISETDKIQFTVIESNKDPLNPNFKRDSSVNSAVFFGSLEQKNDESKIKEQTITVKTSNSDLAESKNNEIVEFLKSNELGYVIPITIAVLTGIVVTWMRVTSVEPDKKKKHFGF